MEAGDSYLNPTSLPTLIWTSSLLMALLSGVNFTNNQHSAFKVVDPKSVKNTVKSSVPFTLLGTAGVKAVRRTLMKLSPGVNFINILPTA